jgi:hypothetical protein
MMIDERVQNMSWNLEGKRVMASYLSNEVAVTGTVYLSRVAYGGAVQHHVKVEQPFSVLGGVVKREAGESIIVNHEDVLRVLESVAA